MRSILTLAHRKVDDPGEIGSSGMLSFDGDDVDKTALQTTFAT